MRLPSDPPPRATPCRRPRGHSALAATTLATLAACSSPPRGASFDSPDPVERSLAAERAVVQRDESAIPDLIQLLRSSDPAVRMIAQRSLEDLTGQDLGYHHADPEIQRAAAIGRWVAWWNQRTQPTPAPSASSPSAHSNPPKSPA